MSEFTERTLKVDFCGEDPRAALLLDTILYELGHKGSGNWLVIPEGIGVNGSNVPRALWWFMPPWGAKASKASIVHDFLIARMRTDNPWPGYETRKAIDAEHRVAMKALGVSPSVAAAIWAGVRAYSLIWKPIRSGFHRLLGS